MGKQENVVDCKRQVNEEGEQDMNEDDWQCARLLGLMKAYPWVSKPALSMLLVRYEMEGDSADAAGFT